MAVDLIDNLEAGSSVRAKLNAAITIVNTNENAQSAISGHLADKDNPHDTSWANLLGVPSEFTPESHTHPESQISDLDRVKWAGEWSAGTYYLNDMVKQGDYTCVCVVSSTTDQPVDVTLSPDWELVSVAGSGGGFIPTEFAGAGTTGYVADPVAEAGKFLRDDGTWQTVSTVSDWADLTGKPTTIAGFGITDAYTDSEVDSLLGGKVSLSGANMTGTLTAANLQIEVAPGVYQSVFYPDNPPNEFSEPKVGLQMRSGDTWIDAPTTLSGYGITDGLVAADLADYVELAGDTMTGTLTISADTYGGQLKLYDDLGPTVSFWDSGSSNRWAMQYDVSTGRINFKYNGSDAHRFYSDGSFGMLVNDARLFIGASQNCFFDYQSDINNLRMLTLSTDTLSFGTNSAIALKIATDQTVSGLWNDNTTHNVNSKIVVLTAAQYAALTPDSNTLYFVT